LQDVRMLDIIGVFTGIYSSFILKITTNRNNTVHTQSMSIKT